MYHSSLTDLGPVLLRSNEYWGTRAGAISKTGQRIFPGRRASNTSHNNSKTPTRKRTTYRNAKLGRPSAQGHAIIKVKGRKTGVV